MPSDGLTIATLTIDAAARAQAVRAGLAAQQAKAVKAATQKYAAEKAARV